MVSALTRKLLRDLLGMKGQVLSIALVVACAVASWSAARGTWAALQDSRDDYYERKRLADVFAVLERAPESLAARIAEIRGVRTLHTRVVERATVPLDQMAEPAQAVVVSIPARSEPPLNALYLRSGRLPEAGHAEEILLGEAFAKAHRIREGDRLPVVLRGVRHELRVVGTALSPEFVFAMGLGQMTFDDRRFAVLWMDRSALGAAVRMESAFNDVVIALQPEAQASTVVADLERLLEPYGKLSVVPREKQMSAKAVDGELSQLRAYATVTPVIFLGVAWRRRAARQCRPGSR
jgi:putative ABC transport system permease protein